MGLNLINGTNLDYFQNNNKAEVLRLKGEFLQRLGDGEAANQSFSAAITMYKNLPKGWISWGNYCDQVYKETGEQLWLEYSVSCLLQGIKCGNASGRSNLARILYLLSFDNQEGRVGKALDSFRDAIPYWVWLPWIPQLLLSLQRPEAPHTKLVLIRVSQMYPQAIYYWLRTYLLERRDVAHRAEVAQRSRAQNMAGVAGATVMEGQTPSQSQGGSQGHSEIHNQGGQPQVPSLSNNEGNALGGQLQTGGVNAVENAGGGGGDSNLGDGGQQALALRRSASSGIGWPSSTISAFEAAKEVMEALRLKHSNLAIELEVMLTEMGSRFVPLPEERLLAVVHALLHRCYKYPIATTAEVPLTLKKELGGVCRACFSVDTVSKHSDFVNEYKHDFERDLDPDSVDTFPKSLLELTKTLKHWEGVLQSNVEERLPAVLKLEDESRQLREWNVLDVELPGQYFADQEAAPEHMVKLDSIGADVPIVRRHGSSHRRITMVGSDGSERHFLVQTSLTPSARSDERMLQLFRSVNKLLDKHKESRRRNLAFHTPILIPVWPQVRLVEDEVTYSTFAEVYEVNCARFGREPDQPIQFFKQRLNEAVNRQLQGEQLVELRLLTYTEITKNHPPEAWSTPNYNYVSESVLSQFMYKSLPSAAHLWTFKKQFAAQLALSGCISYMLHIGGRSPSKILFAKNTGKVFHMDFHPAYDQNGLVECAEPVPFRLTRNLHTFFTQFGTDGLFVPAMCAAAQAMLAPKSKKMEQHLAMFFRDELISWSWRRHPVGGMPSQAAGGNISTIELKQKVTANVDSVLKRVETMAPQRYAEEINSEDDGADAVPLSVQRGVTELVETALRPKNLCMMDPTWHPWF